MHTFVNVKMLLSDSSLDGHFNYRNWNPNIYFRPSSQGPPLVQKSANPCRFFEQSQGQVLNEKLEYRYIIFLDKGKGFHHKGVIFYRKWRISRYNLQPQKYYCIIEVTFFKQNIMLVFTSHTLFPLLRQAVFPPFPGYFRLNVPQRKG